MSILNALRIMHDGRNSSIEFHAVLSTVAFLFLIVFSTISLIKGQEFNAAAFGEAVGIILGGAGFAAIGQGISRKSTKQVGKEDL